MTSAHRRRSVGVALAALLLPIVATLGPASAHADQHRLSGHREVLLERDGDSFRVVSQVRRQSQASEQQRQPGRSPGYRVSARSLNGDVVATFEAADASNVHYDYRPDGGAAGDLAGGTTARPSRRVVVQLPLDPAIRDLELSGEGLTTTVPLAPLPATPAPLAAPPTTTIINNGSVASRVDIVFLGDGYTSAELPTYEADVRRFTDHLFTQAPFSQYADFFNVHRVDLASNQSGTDDTCAGTSVDTALDTGFQPTRSDCRLLWTDSADKVYAAAAGAPSADVIAVLVNTTTYGGAGAYGGYALSYRGDFGPEVLAHELGHSFGLLADEYVEGGTDYSGGEPSQPNVTTRTERGLIKWTDWIAPSTPLPTTSSGPDFPGLYEGALYAQRGIYRPTYDSKMRSLNRPFDRVNSALLVRRIFDFAPFDTTPPSGRVTQTGPVTSSGQVSLSLSYSDADSYVLSYQVSNHSDFRDSNRLPASNAPTFDHTVPWTPLAGDGTKTIWVRVANGSGKVTTQSLTLQSVAPTLVDRTPAAGGTAVGRTSNVTATFSEAVTGVSVKTFTLKNAMTGAAVTGTVARNGTTNQWIFDPGVTLAADTRYRATLTGGATAIRDSAGNPLTTTSWAFTTGPRPLVATRTPAPGSTAVGRASNISATFSEAVSGVTASTFTLRNAATGAVVTGTVARDATTNRWILNPGVNLVSTTRYTATLIGGPAAIRDSAGNPLVTTSWSFTTGTT
jgi:IgA Peptidase M64/Bacterial Ig-like domain